MEHDFFGAKVEIVSVNGYPITVEHQVIHHILNYAILVQNMIRFHLIQTQVGVMLSGRPDLTDIWYQGETFESMNDRILPGRHYTLKITGRPISDPYGKALIYAEAELTG